MLAKPARELPRGPGFLYEPKWDGFRCIVFRTAGGVELGSRNERPLTRYFPELVAAMGAALPPGCVIDGEIVVPGPSGLDFDALSQRIHPAQRRIDELAAATPASFVAFDLLASGGRDLRGEPLAERRRQLVTLLAGVGPPIHLTPATEDLEVAAGWFARFEGAGLDGVVAKDQALTYQPGKRVMVKVKHERTADCVVGGFRTHKDGRGVGSLLLGLHDAAGVLHHVGVASGFSVARRLELVGEVEPYRTGTEAHPWLLRFASTPGGAGPAGGPGGGDPAGGGGPAARVPGGQSRWTGGKDLSWTPLRPELVCEVAYDHLQGDRFRHATSFRRWRPDRDAPSCTYAQLEAPVPLELAEVFAAGD
jgi:ATP-dependent DNA ligase